MRSTSSESVLRATSSDLLETTSVPAAARVESDFATLISETNSNALPYLTTRYKEKDSGVDADTPS